MTIRRHFIELLHEVLTEVHRYNEQHGQWKEQLSLQAYVHTEKERGLLFALLLEALQEPDLAEKAMTLLFHFQGPELMHADRHPGTEVAYPVVVMLDAVSRLLALPVDVSYTLPEVLEALGSTFPYGARITSIFRWGMVCAPRRCTLPGTAARRRTSKRYGSRRASISLRSWHCCGRCANGRVNVS